MACALFALLYLGTCGAFAFCYSLLGVTPAFGDWCLSYPFKRMLPWSANELMTFYKPTFK